jgi:type II secretory pathway predicted ATPase ExeA/pSer/pThr/pTyr-binding forkhead associated (FHA) protein
MDANKSAFGEKAFGKQSGAIATVKYEAQQHALDFIWSLLGDGKAIGLIQGPKGSGKSTVIRQLAKELPRDAAVAVVDGTRLKPRALLSEVLARYGYTPDLQSTDELMKMIAMFAGQQTRAYQPPLLVVDNSDRMFPSSLRTLGKLAGMMEQDKPAIRIVLTGRRAMKLVVDVKRGDPVRPFETATLAPMTANDALIYLHTRLEACGIGRPDSVFPGDVCDVLHAQSGGLPGRLNELALQAIKSSRSLPVTVTSLKPRNVTHKVGSQKRPAPKITISRDGKGVRAHVFNDKKILIGRSEFADIVIDDEFCSKLHVALLLYNDGLVLMDLNSANGTTVNSMRVKTTLLYDNDIISLGNHRLKVSNVPAGNTALAGKTTVADTTRMQSLDQMRKRRRAQLKAVPSGKKA